MQEDQSPDSNTHNVLVVPLPVTSALQWVEMEDLWGVLSSSLTEKTQSPGSVRLASKEYIAAE